MHRDISNTNVLRANASRFLCIQPDIVMLTALYPGLSGQMFTRV